MESGDLKIFRTVAEEESVSRAANHLGYVPSNITTRIRHLETELNTILFYRQSRGMTLTPAGKNLLTYAERILHLLEEAEKALKDTGEPSGILLLGSCQTAASEYFPNVLARYHEQYPAVELSVVTGHSRDLIQKVLHFELDGAFVSSPVAHRDIVEEFVFEEELVLVSPASETDEDCIKHKPILMNNIGCLYRAQVEKWIHAQGIVKARIMEFSTLDAIVGGVIAGLGVTVIPRSSVQKLEAAGLVNSFTIPGPYNSVKTSFIRHREGLLTSAIIAFKDMAGEFTARSNTP